LLVKPDAGNGMTLRRHPNMGIPLQHRPAHVPHQGKHRGLWNIILGQLCSERLAEIVETARNARIGVQFIPAPSYVCSGHRGHVAPAAGEFRRGKPCQPPVLTDIVIASAGAITFWLSRLNERDLITVGNALQHRGERRKPSNVPYWV